MAGEAFFLDAADVSDDLKFLAPKRSGCAVVPLIDGIETFRAMEQAIAAAVKSVHMALWICNALLPLSALDEVNKTLKGRKSKRKVSTWAELFAAVAALGADVRILLTDFDPILQNQLHAACWKAYRLLLAEAKHQSTANLHALCSRHDSQITGLAAGFVVPKQLDRVIRTLNEMGGAAGQDAFADMPGLWPFVTFKTGAKKFERASSITWRLFPASHHQKICIVDGNNGFCGGLDLNTGRMDTKLHSMGWHDTHCRFDGQLAADLDRNFIARWNQEYAIFNTFMKAANSSGKRLAAQEETPITAPQAAATAGQGPATGQLLRTVSDQTVPPVNNLPPTVRNDIERAFRNAIEQANSFIYIENQYVRDTRLADWLISRCAAAANLVVILVLPVAPEEVSEAGGADPVTSKGLYLQRSILTRLQTKLGSRFGMYSMVQRAVATVAHKTNYKAASAESFQIYVHSKTLIVDDVYAMIGSANTNARSFKIDTEANIAWYEPAGVKKLRETLWREMLGDPADLASWTSAQYVAKWDAIAKENFRVQPKLRKGFVVSHNPDTFPGEDSALVPNEYTELVDYTADNEMLA